ncbi:hypothetical protein FEM48_Zijuj10G0052200 [Ziziphus jujuba var. spinosa]|uniref:Poor homologous synapsis 1 PH domain-containing protein n=1 Tax=Ziziphus jujuba var. spinosa TaxID=714518 RepID=A0A978ULH7_ZIZJJ|nr:hypothetical protein FEM48_Zijuj10G0052200 [Ziziphus jujuba var. spinosa]
MAGSHSHSLALIAASEQTPEKKLAIGGGGERWEVEFSRFFNYPPMTSTCPDLVPLPSKVRNRRPSGTWISSSSHVLLQLLPHPSNSDDVVLRVYFRDSILEEHYVSKLHFSWPQVSCLSGFPARGTRAVFASYRDGVGEVQKFALRFSTIYETERFVSALKEIFKVERDTGLVTCGFGSEISSQSEFISSNTTLYRANEDFNVTNPAETYTPEFPPSSNNLAEQYSCTKDTVPPCNFDVLFSALPPSFTSLMENCSSDVEQTAAQPILSQPQEVNIKSQIVRYMEDSTFQDMLVKVEKVLQEMGGDLVL